MASAVFVTGTDTGVGKTIVAAGLTYCLRNAGLDAVPMKPVQTGASKDNGRLVSRDLQLCLRTADLRPSLDEELNMNPYCLETECSPHLAARIEGRPIDLDHISECFRKLLSARDAVVVEGAGGVFAPINESETMLDLIRTMAIPTIIVARRGLGTINHTLLTLQALRQVGVEVFGVILNDHLHSSPEFIGEDNVRTIARLGHVPILGQIEPIRAACPDDICQALRDTFAESVPGWRDVFDRLRRK
jgi:dethiobiotin synthetase